MPDYIITDRKKQNWLMAIVFISVLMFSLDYSMVNLSMPSIAGYFKVKLGIVTWLPIVYILVVTSSLLGFGKLGDIKGYANIFLTGVGVFTAGSLLCGFAANMPLLLASRAFQSSGEAMMAPMGIALITTALPAGSRGKALGIVAMGQGVGFCAGPLIGGLINAHASWRPIFFVNIPIGIIAVLLGRKLLPRFCAQSSGSKFDSIGAALIFVTLAAFVFALNSGMRMGWTNPVIIGCFVLFLAGLAAFIIQERRVNYPILDLKLFSDINFTLASAATFFALFAGIGITFIGPFYLEYLRHMEVAKVGIILMIPSLMMMLMAPISGKLSDKFGARVFCSTGMALAAAAFALFCLFDKSTSIKYIAFSFSLLGIALGLFLAPNNKVVMSWAPQDKQGIASGVYKIMANIGSIMGIALLPLVIMGSISQDMIRQNIAPSQLVQYPDLLVKGFRYGFAMGGIVCALSFLCSVLTKDRAIA